MKVTKMVTIEVCDYCKKEQSVQELSLDDDGFKRLNVCHQFGCIRKALMEVVEYMGFDEISVQMIWAKLYLSDHADQKRKAKII